MSSPLLFCILLRILSVVFLHVTECLWLWQTRKAVTSCSCSSAFHQMILVWSAFLFSNRRTDFTAHSNWFVPNLRLSLLKINWGVRPFPVALWQQGKMRSFSSFSPSCSLLALCIWNEWQRGWVLLCPALQCLPLVIQSSTVSAKILRTVWPRFPFPNERQQIISQEL